MCKPGHGMSDDGAIVKVSATIELILGAVSVFLAIQKGAEEK